jgi:ribonucleotide reductase alpha subunit
MELLMNFEEFLTKLRKHIRNSYQSVGDTMVAGGVTDMEKYKYLLGQAHALQLIDQEISNLLNPKEDKKDEQRDDTNVIKFGQRNTEE